MAKIFESSTFEQIQEFLLFHMDSANDSKSNVNPSLTKEQIWNILMGSAMAKSVRVRNLVIKHAIKEFGSYYENSGEAI
ncbi:hypothetical protein [Schinkia azotoformans]|uniref:hypothetical protein n=1 Tax=Schinkia azotoformans TaxID=1454 RepID=UPI002DB72194|nr:hypothetical protein [Schinkia azotoformans]MEC1714716.1 hypothetical protein [Schinkia azotoformans]MEC1757528.1 hypothetical protein [Schinkia azotoformans]